MRKLKWKPEYYGDTLPALETIIILVAIAVMFFVYHLLSNK